MRPVDKVARAYFFFKYTNPDLFYKLVHNYAQSRPTHSEFFPLWELTFVI